MVSKCYCCWCCCCCLLILSLLLMSVNATMTMNIYLFLRAFCCLGCCSFSFCILAGGLCCWHCVLIVVSGKHIFPLLCLASPLSHSLLFSPFPVSLLFSLLFSFHFLASFLFAPFFSLLFSLLFYLWLHDFSLTFPFFFYY